VGGGGVKLDEGGERKCRRGRRLYKAICKDVLRSNSRMDGETRCFEEGVLRRGLSLSTGGRERKL